MSQADTEYYIAVSGYNGQVTGVNFTLTIETRIIDLQSYIL